MIFVAVAQLLVVRPQEIACEYKRKAYLVPSQEIRLGMECALRMAGMGCTCDICDFAFRSRDALSSQAFRSLDCVGCSSGGYYVHHLSREGRKTALALGKG